MSRANLKSLRARVRRLLAAQSAFGWAGHGRRAAIQQCAANPSAYGPSWTEAAIAWAADRWCWDDPERVREEVLRSPAHWSPTDIVDDVAYEAGFTDPFAPFELWSGLAKPDPADYNP